MKKYILMMAVLMGLSVAETQAQAKDEPAPKQQQKSMPTPEEQADRQTRKATEDLGLTAEQQTQFRAFALERINTVRPLHEKIRATEDKEERKKLHGEVKTANDKFDTSVKGILTAEQLPKWDARKENAMQKRPHPKQKREVQGQH